MAIRSEGFANDATRRAATPNGPLRHSLDAVVTSMYFVGYLNMDRCVHTIKAPAWRQPPEARPAQRKVLTVRNVTSVVYFIRAMSTDFVKIGRARDPQQRLANLQTASPHELVLVATEADDSDSYRETRLHRAFAKQRIRGEWFRYTGPVENYLATGNLPSLPSLPPPLPAVIAPPPPPKPVEPRVNLKCQAYDCWVAVDAVDFCSEHEPSELITTFIDKDDPRYAGALERLSAQQREPQPISLDHVDGSLTLTKSSSYWRTNRMPWN